MAQITFPLSKEFCIKIGPSIRYSLVIGGTGIASISIYMVWQKYVRVHGSNHKILQTLHERTIQIYHPPEKTSSNSDIFSVVGKFLFYYFNWAASNLTKLATSNLTKQKKVEKLSFKKACGLLGLSEEQSKDKELIEEKFNKNRISLEKRRKYIASSKVLCKILDEIISQNERARDVIIRKNFSRTDLP